MPPGIPSSPGSLTPTTKPGPHSARNAVTSSVTMRARPSSSPPQRSVRVFERAAMNWWNRWPCPAEISTPEKPQSRNSFAARAKSRIICPTSSVDGTCGTVQLRSSGSDEGPMASWTRPGW